MHQVFSLLTCTSPAPRARRRALPAAARPGAVSGERPEPRSRVQRLPAAPAPEAPARLPQAQPGQHHPSLAPRCFEEAQREPGRGDSWARQPGLRDERTGGGPGRDPGTGGTPPTPGPGPCQPRAQQAGDTRFTHPRFWLEPLTLLPTRKDLEKPAVTEILPKGSGWCSGAWGGGQRAGPTSGSPQPQRVDFDKARRLVPGGALRPGGAVCLVHGRVKTETSWGPSSGQVAAKDKRQRQTLPMVFSAPEKSLVPSPVEPVHSEGRLHASTPAGAAAIQGGRCPRSSPGDLVWPPHGRPGPEVLFLPKSVLS